MPELQCVALDLDGTLIDSLPVLRRAYEDFLARFGQVGDDEEFARINGPTMAKIVALLKEWRGLEPPVGELLELYYGHVQRAYQNGAPAAAGADELLDYIYGRGWARALVTSTPRRAVEPLLAKVGWREKFDVISCGDEVPEAKPHPAVYLRAFRLGGWEPRQNVAVEDAPAGVQSAVAAGLSVVAVAGSAAPEALLECGAKRVCRDLVEVREVLSRWPDLPGEGIK